MVERTADDRIRTTEWEDIQYKHGNCVGQYRDREVEILAQKVADNHQDALHRVYDSTLEKVQDKEARNGYDGNVEEEFDEAGERNDEQEDAADSDDDEYLAEIRRRRVLEMQKKAASDNFGALVPISGCDYVAEITEGSAKNWVVGLLTELGHEGCEALATLLAAIAPKYRDVKFVSVPVSEALPKFPVKQLPCVVFYHKGVMVHQLTTTEPWGGKRMNTGSVERTLGEYSVIPKEDDGGDEGGEHLRSKYVQRFGM